MKNKLAINAKYFKASQVDGLNGHVMRLFAEDKNAHSHLTKNNFGTPNEKINANYKNAFKNAKGLKKTSNTLIDAVLVFPLEQWQEATKNGMDEKAITKAIVQTMRDIEGKYGLRPIGFKVHLDEGLTDDDGNVVLNPHAHLQFANICHKKLTLERTKKITLKGDDGKAIPDPKHKGRWLYERNETGKVKTEPDNIDLEGKMPLQYLAGRGTDSVWSKMQTMAAVNFDDFGFIRGISKDITQAKHLKNHELTAKKLEESEFSLKKSREENKRLEHINYELKIDTATIFASIESFFEGVRDFTMSAIKGDIEALKHHTASVIQSFTNDVMPENKDAAIDSVHRTLDLYKDEMQPVGKSFAQSLQDTMAEVIEEKEQENPTPLKSKPLPPRP